MRLIGFHHHRRYSPSASTACLAIAIGFFVTPLQANTLPSSTHSDYIKPSNPGSKDQFGQSVALSSDGQLMAISAPQEDSKAGAGQHNSSAANSGAVYLFGRDDAGDWQQIAFLKADNAGRNDEFGASIAFSANGRTLAIGAFGESSQATGINGDRQNDAMNNAGAVYIFRQTDDKQWQQTSYVKAHNTDKTNWFGYSLSLSADGNTLAVGAHGEDQKARGINQTVDGPHEAPTSGAAYVFVYQDGWTQQAYIKASNADSGDLFGRAISLSADGNTLAVGAHAEQSNGQGPDNNQAHYAGAVYLFARDAEQQWRETAYLKARHIDRSDRFGISLSLSANGQSLAVGAVGEDANGTAEDNSAPASGAVYLFQQGADQSWQQTAYLKANDIQAKSQFGHQLSLSADGRHLAIAAVAKRSSWDKVEGKTVSSGGFYLFEKTDDHHWQQRDASLPNEAMARNQIGRGDRLGTSIALSADGSTLLAGARGDDSSARGINGNQNNNRRQNAGAAYVYRLR